MLILLFFGFPLVLILIQWAYIILRMPWLGLAYSLSILLFVVLIGLVVSKSPMDCNPFVDCSWYGLELIVIGYSFISLILSTGAGFIIKSVYKRWVWKPGEIIWSSGKIPSFILMGFILILMAFVLWITENM